MNQDSGARNPGIDLLRGLSILLVVLLHVGIRIPLKRTALGAIVLHRLLDALTNNGYEAVFVFFVISGFLITGNALRRWNSLNHIGLKGFYARRFARIAPLLLSLVLVLSALHLFRVHDYVITNPKQSLGGAVLAALGLHLNWYEGHTGYLPGNWDVLWSLSIEEVFYLGFPIVCLLTRRVWILAPLLVLLALSLPVTHAALAYNPIWQEKAYLPGMAAIATGVLGALIAARFNPPRHWIITGLCIIGAIGLGSVLLVENVLWSWLRDATLLVLTVSTALLLVGLHWRQMVVRSPGFPGFGWLRSFGRYSYEIYLTHMFAVYGVITLFVTSGADVHFGYLWYLPAIGVSWLLGMLAARYFSFPSDHALRNVLLKTQQYASQSATL